MTVLRVGVADRSGHLLDHLPACLFGAPAHARDERLKQVPKPLEHHIVLRHLPSRVPGHPGVDDNRQRDIVECREREVDEGSRGGDVSHGSELSDLVLVRIANDRQRL